MDTLTAIPAPDEDGVRLDRFLSQRFESLSRSRAKALVKDGAAAVNGEALTDPRAGVVAGATYTLIVPDPEPAVPEPEDIPLVVLHEDEHLIVIDKPAGMAVHPAPGTWSGTLVNALLHHCQEGLPGIGGVQRPGIVHRLDKDTTGVMVVAKTEAAHAGLSNLFAERDIERAYRAVTRGSPRPLVGTVDAAIARSTADRKKMAVLRNPEVGAGRRAVTHFRALETFGVRDKGGGTPAAALLECRLETGRTHQIRVHMAHIGAPLVGDQVYGRNRGISAYGSGEAFIAATSAARAFPRQALHAAVLGFVHPVSGEELRFEASWPADIASLVEALRKMPSD